MVVRRAAPGLFRLSMYGLLLFFFSLAQQVYFRTQPAKDQQVIPIWQYGEMSIDRDTTAPKLPAVLSTQDASNYRTIFKHQQQGNFASANALLNSVSDGLLKGHVLAQRYLDKRYAASRPELDAWLEKYADHPQAYKIYEKAASYDPEFKAQSAALERQYLKGYGDGSGLGRSIEYTLPRSHWDGRAEAYKQWQHYHALIKRGRVSQTFDEVKDQAHSPLLTKEELGLLFWRIAEGFYAYQHYGDAYSAASEALNTGEKKAQRAHWMAGFAAWHLRRWRDASVHFSALAELPDISDWDKSTGYYWAYRAFKRRGYMSQAVDMAEKAAEYPHTFYGKLGRSALGLPLQYNWFVLAQGEDDASDLRDSGAVKRAYALKQLGQNLLAEKELRRLFLAQNENGKRQILQITRAMNFPGLEIRMALRLLDNSAQRVDASLYPIPFWRPKDDFTLHPALLFAVIRHESGFNTYASSPDGAKGLMQLMPATAHYMARKNNYRISLPQLIQPELNMTTGQDYIEYLLSQNYINNNLIYMLAAYNAGPANLKKWQRQFSEIKDPLLFIETLSSSETRYFIKRVLSNYWIYRDQMGAGVPSLNQLVDEIWPIYDDTGTMNAPKAKIALHVCPSCPTFPLKNNLVRPPLG